jgi:ribosomal protein S27AE
MGRGCRDCPRCTESLIDSAFKLPFRVAYALLTFWNIGLFRRYCPRCGHKLSIHQRLSGGRFAD